MITLEGITLQRFDEAVEELYREISAQYPGADIIAGQVAYAEMLRRKLFGPREKGSK